MSIQIKTPGLHHIALRTSDLSRSKKFYCDTLGFPVLLETPDICIMGVGSFALALRAPADSTASSGPFSPFRVGIDHLALAAPDEKEIDRVAQKLKDLDIWTYGPVTDPALGKYYLAFKDPDGIKLEYYLV